jgi:hypothetical protein
LLKGKALKVFKMWTNRTLAAAWRHKKHQTFHLLRYVLAPS